MNNTTYLVVRSPHSINPSKAEKEMTASLFPIIPVSETTRCRNKINNIASLINA
jgi:hypothetical protein